MYLHPFLAVAILFLGIVSAMVGNRLLRYASGEGETRAGYWCFTGGLITIMAILIFDPTALGQVLPEISKSVKSFVNAE